MKRVLTCISHYLEAPNTVQVITFASSLKLLGTNKYKLNVKVTVLETSGAGFMKGLKSGLRLKSETLGSNVVNILLSLWTQTQSISQTGST